ncbi:MAG: hypothetical protein IPH30_07390 [Betaproteobacteria bacterium]|nr:hypothetical protein [Betaproteobacteria bacterium]
MADPGLAFRSTTLPGALSLVAGPLGVEGRAPATDITDEALAVEDAATSIGLRSRRVLLDGRWWAEGGTPMLARVAERRRVAREYDAAPDGTTGWVALIPKPFTGYHMVALDPAGGPPVHWPVDEETARRLAPFAFAFHRTFDPRPLGTRDVLRFAFGHARADISALLATGLVAALIGLLTPVATGRLIDRVIPAGSGTMALAIIAGLAAAGLAGIVLEVLRAIAVLRFEARTSVAIQAAVLDRVIGAPARFFRAFSSGDLAMRLGAVNTVQRTVTGASIGAFVAGIFLTANFALMLAYSTTLSIAALGVVAVTAILSAALGIARLSLGRRIEAADGKLSAMSFEYFAGIAKLRAAAAESRAFSNWLARYRDFRELNRRSAWLSNLESVLLSILQPAAATSSSTLPGGSRRARPRRRSRSANSSPSRRRCSACSRACTAWSPRGSTWPPSPRCGSAPSPSSRRLRRTACAARSATTRKARSISWASPSPIPTGRPCSTTSTCRSGRGNSSRSWGPAARASRPCCGCCWGSSSPGPARCATTAACCRPWT